MWNETYATGSRQFQGVRRPRPTRFWGLLPLLWITIGTTDLTAASPRQTENLILITLDGLRIVKLLGCVNSTLDFTDQHLVINGASDLLHEIFGKEGDGYHARSALGFAALPTGAAVEIEAILEIPD